MTGMGPPTLPLLVLWVLLAYDEDATAALRELALLAHQLHGGAHLHCDKPRRRRTNRL